MINRIDLFMPPFSQYGQMHHFTKKFHEALLRAGIESQILVADRENPRPFLESLFGNRPDATLSFNGLLPDKRGTFFCDLIEIPHVACLLDSSIHFLQLKNSPLSIVTCPDKDGCAFFEGLGFKHSFFLPPAVEKELADQALDGGRDFDVVMFSSCIDYEKIRNSWKEKFPPFVCQAMKDACEITLQGQGVSFTNAFAQALDALSRKERNAVAIDFDLIDALNEIEAYIKGIDRVALIRALTGVKIDVFGSGDWQKYVGGQKNVRIHDSIPYEEVTECMGRSKIVLVSCPWLKKGVHENVFAAMARGACVVTNDSLYLQKEFLDGKDILLFQHGSWDDLNKKIIHCLENDNLRKKIILAARKKVKENHTWDNRVKTLLKELPPILEEIRRGISP